MHGIVDPITLGFILSLVGSVTVLSLETPGSSDQIEQQVTTDSVEMSQQLPESDKSRELPGS
jgi:hypothetical protein